MMYGFGPDGPLGHYAYGAPYTMRGGWIFPMGFGLLLLVGFVVLLVMLTRPHAFHHAGHLAAQQAAFVGRPVEGVTAPQRDPAEDIARERFARGEIDTVEFDRIVAALRSR